MSRRVAMLGRRGVRPTHPQAFVSVQAILGSLLVEMWDSEQGLSISAGKVVSWTGLIRGTVLTPVGVPNRPTYAADGTFFNGRSVVKSVSATSACVKSATLGTPLLLTGTRPAVYSVFRVVTYPVATRWMTRLTDAAPGANGPQHYQTAGTTLNGGFGFAAQAFNDTTAPHRFQNTLDSAGTEHVTVDSTDATGGLGLVLAVDITRAAIGGNVTGSNVSDNNVALHLILSSQMSTVQLAQLNAFVLAKYNV